MLNRFQLAELVLHFFTREDMAITSMSPHDLDMLAVVKQEMHDAALDIRLHDLHPFRDEPGIFADRSN